MEHRVVGHSVKNRRTEYLVKWKEELRCEASWEKDVDLWQFERHIKNY